MMQALRDLADRLHQALGLFSRMLNAVGTFVVLGLVVAVNADVIARGAFNAPFRGTVELVQFSMVLIVFLQLPDLVRSGKLTRSDGFLLFFGGVRPRLTGAIRRSINFVSSGLMLLVAITIWPEFVEAWKTDFYFGTPGIFTAPWWPVRLVIFISALMCTALWLCKAFGTLPEGPDAAEEAHL